MATDYQATSIGSGVAQQTTMNAEWAAIELALSRVLNVYGDDTVGTNAMQVDFDMNSNDILNGGVGNFTDIIVNGSSVAASAAAAATSATEAAASAASINLPTLTAADPGRLVVVNDTYDGYDIATHFHIDHTATEDGDHVLEIACDTAGFADVKAIELDYITGAMAVTDEHAIVNINIDQSLSIGGHIYANNVAATANGGGAHVHALRAGATVAPIQHDSGTFVNPTTGTNNTQSTDVAAMIDGSTGTTTSIFVADDDYIIIGAAAAFQQMEVILTTEASGAGIKPTFWYSITGTHQFTQFYPIDGTDGFKHSGIISWEGDLSGHVADAVTGTYDIKIIRTQNTLTTNPVLGYAKAAAITEYYWDESGNLGVNGIALGGNTLDAAHTLDDYEEGTWTPVLSDGSNDATSSVAAGTYTKIGRMVHVKARLTISSLGSVAGSATRITGLPFTAENVVETHGITSFGYAFGMSFTAGNVMSGYVTPNTSYILLRLWDDTGGTSSLTAAEWTASSDVMFEATYYV